MFDLDKWQEIFATINKNKMRTFLTGFSVAWGIFMLMVLLGSGNGLSNGVASNFMGDAVNAMWIWSGETSVPYQGLKSGRSIQFHNDDYEVMKSLPGVKTVSGQYFMGSTRYSYGKETGEYTTTTCHPELNDMDQNVMLEGRYINDLDIIEKRKVVVLGKDIYDALFKDKPALGEYIKINNIPFRVVGVCMEPESTRNRNGFVPVTTAQTVFNGSNRLHNFAITISGTNLAESQAIEDNIRSTFSRKLKFDKEDDSALGVYNKMENFLQAMRIFQAIKIFIWIIGIFTLIAGIIGVSNIMLIVVKERTKEIGIRKALGASPSSVIGLIIMESVLITTLAGYIGLVLGTALMEFINFLMTQSAPSGPQQGETLFLNPTVDFGVAVSATVLLIIAGTLAGYIPAKRAASIKPIVALRDE